VKAACQSEDADKHPHPNNINIKFHETSRRYVKQVHVSTYIQTWNKKQEKHPGALQRSWQLRAQWCATAALNNPDAEISLLFASTKF